MSAQFIIEYGGMPVAIDLNHAWVVVREDQATRFASEVDAWWAAYKAGMPHRCRVVDLYQRNQDAGRAQSGAHGVTRPTGFR